MPSGDSMAPTEGELLVSSYLLSSALKDTGLVVLFTTPTETNALLSAAENIYGLNFVSLL